MKAELNEKNELVVTMSRGEAHRVANAAWNYESPSTQQYKDCVMFAELVEETGVHDVFTK